MLYFKCPTCKTLLANKQLLYEGKLDSICKNSKMSINEKNNAKMKILDELELHRPCCRMRIMGNVTLIDKIK